MPFFTGLLAVIKKIASSSATTSRAVILTQALLGLFALIYFISTEQYRFIGFSIVGMFVLEHVGHNVGLHRYFTHNAFKTSRFWHIFLCFFSCLVCSGSPFSYTVAHRAHHLYTDTDKDPHHAGIGFFRVMLYQWDLKHIPIHATKGLSERWIQAAHQNYVFIVLGFFAFLVAIDYRYALAYSLSVMAVMFGEAWVNFLNHTNSNPFAYRNFDTPDKSSNDLIAGYFFGEWHNNHHKYPSRYNEQVRWWEVDIPAIFIKAIKK